MNKNFVIISSIDWSIHWQLHHQLTKSLIDSGNRVLFIENTGVRKIKLKDTPRLFQRIKSRFKSFGGFSEINKKLTIFIPIIFPIPYSKFFIFLNEKLLVNKIKKWMKICDFKDPIFITFLPTPLIHRFLDNFISPFIIYYCANHMAEGSTESKPLRKWEDRMFQKANLVFSISDLITKRASKFSNKVCFFPPGVDLDKFIISHSMNVIPKDITNIKKPILGYVGTIGSVLDLKTIEYIASKLKNYSIVLIGPIYTNVSKLLLLPNVFILGEKKHEIVASYIKIFDVALIPYIKSDFTDNVYSCKINEYLSLGVPVVSSNTNEVENFNKNHENIIEIASSPDEYIEKIISSIKSNTNNLISKRIQVAEENSWKKRFENLYQTIETEYNNYIINKKSIKFSFKNLYLKSRNRIIKFISIIFIFYLLIFYSPLFWFLGDKLVIRNLPQPSDAIVVFSGDGESTYINPSYQKRTLDSLNYYKKGYANKLILSSGKKQTVSEVEMLRAILIDKGVPKDVIYIFESYPNSTYENVIMVRNYLYKNNYKKVLFITAPFHSKRSSLIWKKNAKNIEIINVPVIDNPPIKIQWKTSIASIKVILYEYLAIVYNRYKKRL